MNIVKSHLKHINIKFFSPKKKKNIKIKLFINPKHAETPRNINMYISMVFLVPEQTISGVSAQTVRNLPL